MWSSILRFAHHLIGAPALLSGPPGPAPIRVPRVRPPRGQAVTAEPLLLRVLCHELRTPVASVTALAGALDADLLGGDDRREAIRLITAHARHLSAVLDAVRQLTDACGPATGERGVGGGAVPLADVVAGAVDAAGLTGSTSIVVHLGDDHVPEPAVLRRVLTNLLENARIHASPPLQLDVRRSGPAVLECVVADAGPGLPWSVAQAIGRRGPATPPPVAAPPCPPGHTGPAVTDLPVTGPAVTPAVTGPAVTAGSGLGLWIVRQLVISAGGRIDVLPGRVPHVTRIRVRLPVGTTVRLR